MNTTSNILDSGPVSTPPGLDPLPSVRATSHPRELTMAETLIAGPTILLSDDDPGVREMLGRLLVSERYRVICARTGREAASQFENGNPDLVLLDLNMPDQDGWQAFSRISEKNPLIPVIVITARPGQYPRAVELGIDALMEKPLNLPLLLETVRALLLETESERLRRVTNPQFKTAYLKLRPFPGKTEVDP